MISCIIVDSSKTINFSYKKVFEEIFHGDCFEVNEHINGMTLIYIHSVEKIKVWQAVLNLEVNQSIVGFGFGAEKEEARGEALDRLEVISEMKTH